MSYLGSGTVGLVARVKELALMAAARVWLQEARRLALQHASFQHSLVHQH